MHSSDLVREIPLKIRCRADVHKIPVLSVRPVFVSRAESKQQTGSLFFFMFTDDSIKLRAKEAVCHPERPGSSPPPAEG